MAGNVAELAGMFTYHGAGAVQDTEANAASVRMVERYNRSHRPR